MKDNDVQLIDETEEPEHGDEDGEDSSCDVSDPVYGYWEPEDNDQALRALCLQVVTTTTAAPYAEHTRLAAQYEDYIRKGRASLKAV